MGRGTLAKLVKAAASVQQPKAAKDKKRNNAEHPSIVEKQAKKYKSGHARSTNSMSAGMAKHAPPVVSVEVDVPSVQDSAGAYQALVSMLSSGMGSSSAALRRRQHEAAQGDSDGSEDEVDLEGGGSQDDEDEAGSSELDEDEVEGCSEDALEQDVDGDSEMADEAEEGGEGKEVHDSDGGDSEADEQPTPAPNAAGSNDNEETTPMAPTQSGAGHSAAPEDTWARHVEHLLPNEQVAELEGGSRRTKFTESESPSLQGTFPDATWQACGVGATVAAPPSLSDYSVKDRLVARWREVHAEERRMAGDGDTQGAGAQAAQAKPEQARRGRARRGQGAEEEVNPATAQTMAGGDFDSDAQRALFGALHSYADVLVSCRPYPTSLDDPDGLMDAYLLHCLNHVAKTADRIKRNNDKLDAARKAGHAAGGEGADAEGVPRDQGFTRPKVLVLLPTRNLAFKLVRRLVGLATREARTDSVQGKERFVEQFTDPEGGDADLDEGAARRRAAKPAEWRALFDGNTDDHFRLGIKITRGAIKLFANMFESDIIVASPIAIATKLAEDVARAEAGAEAAAGGKRAAAAASKAKAAGSRGDGACDFLSSIEVLVVDRADVLAMQNWAHIETVVEALNRVPREQHGVDIMRVREWHLSGWARHYRQTVLLTSFLTPDMNAVLGGPLCTNYRGRLRVAPVHRGVLGQVIPQVQQVFERFTAPTPAHVASARFDYFTKTVWPRLREGMGVNGLLLFVPSYFDFIRVRNFLKAEDDEVFEAISEYTDSRDVVAARSRFFHRHVRILLYTERAHFYHRHRLRGIKDVLFYAPPEHAAYYPELLNLIEDAGSAGAGAAAAPATLTHHASVGLLFCRWDILALERVVGSARAKKMLKADASTFMFC